MARTDWQYNEIVTETDMNRLGAEINMLKSVIVAPHNSLRKDEAQYILTGVDDQVLINQIITEVCSNAASTFGQWIVPKIHFLEGDIILTGAIILKNGVFIEGEGYNTRFLLADNANITDNAMFLSEDYDNQIIYSPILKEIRVDGNYDNNQVAEYYGIKIKAQELLLDHVVVENCRYGVKTHGSGADITYIRDCVIKNNHTQGISLGSNATMSGTTIIGNAKTDDVPYQWDACGLFIDSYNCQIVGNNHFTDNGIDIITNWCAYIQIIGNIFEAGRRENIVIVGRAWGFIINDNRFGGRRSVSSDGSTDAIHFKDIDPNEKAFGNQICKNSFTCYETSTDVGYNYCIFESENCDQNLIQGNVFKGGYSQSVPVFKVGEQTVVTNNIDNSGYTGSDDTSDTLIDTVNSGAYVFNSGKNLTLNDQKLYTIYIEHTPTVPVTITIDDNPAYPLSIYDNSDYQVGTNADDGLLIANHTYQMVFNAANQRFYLYKAGGVYPYNSEFKGVTTIEKLKSSSFAEFDAADLTLNGNTLISDSLCWSGNAAQMLQPSSSPAQKTIDFQYTGLRYGDFYVAYRLKCNNKTTSSTVATVSVRDTSNGNIVQLAIKGTDFTGTTEYQIFRLSFTNKGQFSGNTIRIRVACEAIASIEIDIDSIIVAPIGLGAFGV